MNRYITFLITFLFFYNCLISLDSTSSTPKNTINKYSVVLDSLHTSPILRTAFRKDLQNWNNINHLPILVCDSLIPASGATSFIKEYIAMKFTPDEIRDKGYDSIHKTMVRALDKQSQNSKRTFSKELATLQDSPEPKLIVFMYPLDSMVIVATIFPYWDNYKDNYRMYSYFMSEVELLVQFDQNNKITTILHRKAEK